MRDENVRPEISIRRIVESDFYPMATLFYRAVHIGAAALYSEEQRTAWAPDVPDCETLSARLREQTVFVAETPTQPGTPIGFMTLSDSGLIDMAFVDPDWAGRGVGGRLHDAVLKLASDRNLESLTTEASLIARPFFEKQGWSVIRSQTVQRDGVDLQNFLMRRAINPSVIMTRK